MRYAVLLLTITLLGLALAFYRGDETLSAYGAADQTWKLTTINGTAFIARATITFPEQGHISGHAPCNTYFATQGNPYPWFTATEIGATKLACANLPAEQEFFTMLEKMTLSEVSGPLLILSTEFGDEMVFTAFTP